MRFRIPLAILSVSLVVASEETIDIVPVMAFLLGIVLALMPPAIPGRYAKSIVLVTALLLPVVFPAFTPYMPLAIYWIAAERETPYLMFASIPALALAAVSSPQTTLITIGIGVLAYLLGEVSETLYQTEQEAVEDVDKERARRLKMEADREKKDKEASQEIRLATLAERNRIARELHDTIGHVLSSALLQTTALLTVTDDQTRTKSIKDIQATLNQGMDQARKSVHGLYERSLSFERELKESLERYTHWEIQADVAFQKEPDLEKRQTMLKVVSEAMTNVLRHSNATKVKIRADEHPGFYRLQIKDNGTRILSEEEEQARGGVHLGINTMEERARRLGGRISIDRRDGFGVTLFLPKRQINEARMDDHDALDSKAT